MGLSDKAAKSNPRAYRPAKAYHGFAQKSMGNTSTWGDKSEVINKTLSSSAPAMNPSSLNEEQIKSADKAERRRNAPIKDVPCPEEDDATETDGKSTYLYADKNRIMWLTKEMKRIKSQNHSADYLRKRDKAIKAAEEERLAGGLEPVHLSGIKFPWSSDHGRAPVEYENDQVKQIKERNDNIKRESAELFQLEYSATKGGPGGQARRYVQLLDTARSNSTFLKFYTTTSKLKVSSYILFQLYQLSSNSYKVNKVKAHDT
jgi:hypothetical protein